MQLIQLQYPKTEVYMFRERLPDEPWSKEAPHERFDVDATPAEGHSLGSAEFGDTLYYYLNPHQDMTPEDQARWADIVARTS